MLNRKVDFCYKVFFATFSILTIISISLITIPVKAVEYTLSYDCNLPSQRTKWDDVCNFPKFDSSIGNLSNIRIDLTNTVNITVRLENLDASPRSLDVDYGSNIKLFVNNEIDPSIDTIPTTNITENLPVYDEIADFDGESGRAYPVLTAGSTEVLNISPADPQGIDFIGTGNIDLVIDADSYTSFNSGLAANLYTFIETFAGVDLRLTYTYQAHNLRIEKDYIGSFVAGQSGIYKFTVTNLEDEVTPTPLTVIDNLPSGMSFVSDNSSDWDCSFVAPQLSCQSNQAIVANGTSEFEITVSLSQDLVGDITNTAGISGTLPIPVLVNRLDSDVVNVTAYTAPVSTTNPSPITLITPRTGGW